MAEGTGYRNEVWLLDHVAANSLQLWVCKSIASVTLQEFLVPFDNPISYA
jgi:hypothetical protein